MATISNNSKIESSFCRSSSRLTGLRRHVEVLHSQRGRLPMYIPLFVRRDAPADFLLLVRTADWFGGFKSSKCRQSGMCPRKMGLGCSHARRVGFHVIAEIIERNCICAIPKKNFAVATATLWQWHGHGLATPKNRVLRRIIERHITMSPPRIAPDPIQSRKLVFRPMIEAIESNRKNGFLKNSRRKLVDGLLTGSFREVDGNLLPKASGVWVGRPLSVTLSKLFSNPIQAHRLRCVSEPDAADSIGIRSVPKFADGTTALVQLPVGALMVPHLFGRSR